MYVHTWYGTLQPETIKTAFRIMSHVLLHPSASEAFSRITSGRVAYNVARMDSGREGKLHS